jgi:hypothetical protein
MKYFTDYDISWDYELDEQTSPQIKTQVMALFVADRKQIEKKYPFVKWAILIPIVLSEEGLGVYCMDTKQWIGIDIENHIKAIKEYSMDFSLAIRMTVVHELAHLIQNYYNKPPNEDEAEDFARDFIDFGQINKI